MRKSTISDVAALAGVSIATVSHALNKTKFVSDGVRKRVVEAAEELDYRPSGVASSLRRQSSGVIGLVLPMQGQDTSAVFFTQLADGIENTLMKHGYRTIVSNTEEDAQRQRDQIQLLRGHFTDFIDGMIIAPTGADTASWLENLRELPVVYVDRYPAHLAGSVNYVGTNNYDVTRQGLKEFLAAGMRNIVCISSRIDVSSMVDRHRAFIDTVGPVAADIDRRTYVTESSFAGGHKAGIEVLDTYPDLEAIFVTNNTVGMGVLKAIQERNLERNGLRLLIYDDYDWMSLIDPPLDAIAQPAFAMGQAAADLLVRKLKDPQMPDEQRTISSTLVFRSPRSENKR